MTNNNQAAEREAFDAAMEGAGYGRPERSERGELLYQTDADKAIGWELRAAIAQPASSIPIPTTEAEAELMQKLGYAWLKEHAPHRLVQPASSEEPVAWRKVQKSFRGGSYCIYADDPEDIDDTFEPLYTHPAAQGNVVMVPRTSATAINGESK